MKFIEMTLGGFKKCGLLESAACIGLTHELSVAQITQYVIGGSVALFLFSGRPTLVEALERIRAGDE